MSALTSTPTGFRASGFFSLDASKVIPAVAARMLFALPYHKAVMDFAENSPDFRFSSQRLGISTAEFEATWRTGVRLRDPDVESLAFFLVERYCYFASTSQGLTMTRIYHHPWILDEAVVSTWKSTMLGSLSLTEPDDPPLAHFSRSLNVQIWAPTPVS